MGSTSSLTMRVTRAFDQAQNTSVNTPAAQRNPDGFHVVLSPVYSIR
jgi:hypothetical protein